MEKWFSHLNKSGIGNTCYMGQACRLPISKSRPSCANWTKTIPDQWASATLSAKPLTSKSPWRRTPPHSSYWSRRTKCQSQGSLPSAFRCASLPKRYRNTMQSSYVTWTIKLSGGFLLKASRSASRTSRRSTLKPNHELLSIKYIYYLIKIQTKTNQY